MIEYLKGLWRGWRGLPAEERGICAVGVGAPPPMPPPVILKRFPKYPLGCTLRSRGRLGIVNAIFCDYKAALNSGAVFHGWAEAQGHPPSSQDQIFYLIITLERMGENADGPLFVSGSIIAGENDVELVEGR
jgi:hypothetical protein